MATRRKSTTKKKTSTRKSNAATKKNQLASSFELIAQAQKFVNENKILTGIGAVVLTIVLLLAFPFRFLIVPAIVNGQPIFSWQYVSTLHKNSGQQVLNQIISEKLVEQEIAKQGIQVTQAEIDEQISQIEEQFGEEAGGLDALLALQGLSRDEFVKQLRLNTALEKIVKGTIEISEEEVAEELTTNTELYQDLAEVDAATTAAENIRNNRLQEAFQGWFQGIRETANIQNFFTSSEPNPLQTLPQ